MPGPTLCRTRAGDAIFTQMQANVHTSTIDRHQLAARSGRGDRLVLHAEVDRGALEDFVHAADGAELAAHGAGVAVVVLGQAGVPDGLGGLGSSAQANCASQSSTRRASPILSSMSRAWGMPLAMSAAWAAILEATMPCFTSSTLGRARCSAGSHSTGRLHR